MFAGYASSGNGWRLAQSLQVLAAEISERYPSAVCLGTKGDSTHAAEGTSSDHNPFVLAPDGVGIVRAIDIGGPPDVQQAIFDHLAALYKAHDPRLFFYGYIHKDNVITNWSNYGGTHTDDGDVGHVHVSVTQSNGGNPSPGHSGYVAAIDESAPWGFLAPKPVIPPVPKEWSDMATEAEIRAIVAQECAKAIHFDNLRQAQVLMSGHGNKAYSAADVAAINDTAHATPVGIIARFTAILAKK